MASITQLRMIYLSYTVWIFEQEYSEQGRRSVAKTGGVQMRTPARYA